jgi:UDP-2,3-diacylglucosamine hydrolase
MEIAALSSWQTVDFISDLHLQSQEPATLTALTLYLGQTPAQAVFILGDLFEVWVGDDVLELNEGYQQAVAGLLRQASSRLAVFIMCGNRDFLMGQDLIEACGAKRLEDPSVLQAGSMRWLLVHGDALCLADAPYQAFRAKVRSQAWQSEFLRRPLADRLSLARQMRSQSEMQKQQFAQTRAPWIDLDQAACLELIAENKADHLIHGHTHHPDKHDLGNGHVRWVLSDWDLYAIPPRAEVLRLHVTDGALERVNLIATP